MQQLSLQQKRWVQNNHKSTISDFVEYLRRERGIRNKTDLQDSSVFPDMEKAVKRIEDAIENGERIGIFGDYDCDGTTAALQLARYFRRRNVIPLVRLPHRVHDGYGFSRKIVDEFREAPASLIITVDTGVANADAIAYAQQFNIDVIVTDHHNIPEIPPDAFALLHPDLTDLGTSFAPSGSGVAHYLLRALERGSWKEQEIDEVLAMLGTVADLVPLTGDNRTLVQRGLKAAGILQNGPLVELMQDASLKPLKLTSTDVAFRLAPRINAAGRMADPRIAYDALLKGGEAIQELSKLNTQRQDILDEYVRTALEDADQDSPVLCSANASYPHGLTGLIAGRLTERSGKPSLVVRIDGEECVGSLRSPSCVHITKALERHSVLFSRLGGHARAAGCAFPAQSWDAVCEALRTEIALLVSEDDLIPTIDIDAEISLQDVSLDFIHQLQELEPFGSGNPEPLFLLSGITLDHCRPVGSDASHLQCRVGPHKAIGFGLAHLGEHLGQPRDIVCTLSIDEWNGFPQPQVMIRDIR